MKSKEGSGNVVTVCSVLQHRAEDESGSDGGSMSFNKLTIIVSVALGSVIVVLLLILVVTCCKTRTGGSTPV